MKMLMNAGRLAGFALACCFLHFWFYRRSTVGHRPVYGNDEIRLSTRHLLTQSLLKRQHDFVPATNSDFYYGGRWERNLDQEVVTSIPGSYIDFTVSNITSFYVATRTYHLPHDRVDTELKWKDMYPIDAAELVNPSSLISGNLVVEIVGRTRRQYNLPSDTIKPASDLDPSRTYHIRVVFLFDASHPGMTGSEFEGIWLARGGRMGLEGLYSKAYIDAVTSTAAGTLESYPALLASNLSLSHNVIASSTGFLKATAEAHGNSLQAPYFGTKQSYTAAVQFAHRFDLISPSAIVLEFGTTNIRRLLARKLSDKALNQALRGMVKEYKSSIQAIRTKAYQHRSEMTSQTQIPGVETSFAYNSEQSPVPIFLLSPFCPSVRLEELSSHVISEVVRALRADGDLATLWVDTGGWLFAEDFLGDEDELDGKVGQEGHVKIAEFLSQHLCPFLRSHGECPYPRPSKYEGSLYLPNEAGLGKLLEERKLQLIRERMGLSTGT